MAAGMTVRRDQFEVLAEAIRRQVASMLDGAAYRRSIKVEAKASLADLKPSLHQEIQMLAPFGLGNREPILLARNVEVLRAEGFGSDGRHLRVQLRDATAARGAIAFDKAPALSHLPPGRRLDILYTLDCERWDGYDRIRLPLRGSRPAQAGPPSGRIAGPPQVIR